MTTAEKVETAQQALARHAAEGIEHWVMAHALNELTPEQAADQVFRATVLRRYADLEVFDEATATATYLPISRS